MPSQLANTTKTVKRHLRAFLFDPAQLYARYVLGLGLVFGLAFVFLVPPMQGADEPNHFMRAYQISQGNIVSEFVGNSTGGINPELRFYKKNLGGKLPAGIVDVAQLSYDMHGDTSVKMTRESLDALSSLQITKETKNAAFPNTAAYSPAAYLPSVIGIWLGRLFHARPLTLMYLARLSGLLFGVLLLALATYLIPFAKLPFAVIALLPMTLGELAVVSADTVAIALSFFLVALVLHYCFRAKDLSNWDWLLLAVTCAAMALNKQALLPLTLLTFGLLANKSIPRPKALAVALSCLIAAAGLGMYWNSLVRDLVVAGYHLSYLDSDYHHQSYLLFHHSSRYWKVLYEAFLTARFNIVVIGLIGAFGWLDTILPFGAVAAGYVLIALAILLAALHDKIIMPKWLRWLLIASGIGVTLATATLLFLLTMSPLRGYNLGLQGRYLTPALLVLAVALAQGKRKRLTDVNYRQLGRRVLYGSAGLLAIMTYVVTLRYY